MEKLIKKNAKLKGKLAADGIKCNNTSLVISTKDVGTMTCPQRIDSHDNYSIDVNRLRIDRDFYQQEYLKLLNRPLVDGGEVCLLRKQLVEKDHEIKVLRKQLDNSLSVNEASLPCRAVEATIHRLEREKRALQETIDRLTRECNDLRECLHSTDATQRDQFNRDECEMKRLRQRIQQLESESLSLKTMEATSKSTVAVLKDEMAQLQAELSALNDENVKLRTSVQQLRLLQEQTENALVEHQTRLSHCERQRNQAESRLSVIDSSRTDGYREIGELRAENTRLKTLNTTITKEKDKLIVSFRVDNFEEFQEFCC